MDSVVVVVFSQLLLQPHLNGTNGGDMLLSLAFSTHFFLKSTKSWQTSTNATRSS